jgi:hypothetical protein
MPLTCIDGYVDECLVPRLARYGLDKNRCRLVADDIAVVSTLSCATG